MSRIHIFGVAFNYDVYKDSYKNHDIIMNFFNRFPPGHPNFTSWVKKNILEGWLLGSISKQQLSVIIKYLNQQAQETNYPLIVYGVVRKHLP